MPWNGSGTYSLPPAYSPEVNGDVIDAVRYNGLTTDLATGITNAFAKDGQNVPTANLAMGGFKFTGLAAGAAAGDSLRFEQVSLKVAEATITLTASSSDIGASAAGGILLTGTGITVTAFPAASLGTVKVIRFDGVNTLTHAVGFSLPNNGSNLTTAAGDRAVVAYTGSGWNFISYTKANGTPLQASPGAVSQLTAAAATNTINNTTYSQNWQWTFGSSTSTVNAFYLNETAAGSGGSGIRTLLRVASSSDSQTYPGVFTWAAGTGQTGRFGFESESTMGIGTKGSIFAYAATIGSDADGGRIYLRGADGVGTNKSGGLVYITAGTGVGSGNAGEIRLTAGNAASGGGSTGGLITLVPGTGTNASKRGYIDCQGPMIFSAIASAPTITSGAGSGATIAGTDNAFFVTLGSGAGTSIVIALGRGFSASTDHVAIAQINSTTITTYARVTGGGASVTITCSATPSGNIAVLVFPLAA